MEWQASIMLVALCALYGITFFTDIRYRKIYNSVTFPAMLISFLACIYTSGFLNSIIFFFVVMVLCLVCEFMRFWKSGDSKLILAASMMTALLLESITTFTAASFFLSVLMMYLFVGHCFWLKQCNYSLRKYFQELKSSFRQNQVIGRLPGAGWIGLANLLFLLIHYVPY